RPGDHLAPDAILAERQQVIDQVVAGGDTVEHGSHLGRLLLQISAGHCHAHAVPASASRCFSSASQSAPATPASNRSFGRTPRSRAISCSRPRSVPNIAGSSVLSVHFTPARISLGNGWSARSPTALVRRLEVGQTSS